MTSIVAPKAAPRDEVDHGLNAPATDMPSLPAAAEGAIGDDDDRVVLVELTNEAEVGLSRRWRRTGAPSPAVSNGAVFVECELTRAQRYEAAMSREG
jgi:hypothetical protein